MTHAAYRFAIDCVTGGRVSALSTAPEIETRTVCQALNYGLSYSRHDDRKASGYIRPAEARAVLQARGCAEPPEAGQPHRVFMQPQPVKPEGRKEHWPINAAYNVPSAAAVWGLILGIERGWFAYDRAGFLHWTPAGRDRFAAADSPVVVDSATGQAAFAF